MSTIKCISNYIGSHDINNNNNIIKSKIKFHNKKEKHHLSPDTTKTAL